MSVFVLDYFAVAQRQVLLVAIGVRSTDTAFAATART